MTTTKREKVYEIADDLLRQGIKPTQQNVRDRLGSGSLTTINKALNEWWSGLGRRLDAQASGYDLPEPVIKLASKIWNDAIAYASRASESKHKEADREREKLASDLAIIDSKYSNEDLLEARVRLKIQAEEIARLNAEVMRLSTENAQLKLK